ncbi:MAG: cobalamin B12-binding domain-containing protein [Candidatus Omnitrophica bacterium]|nr:cobalamin B12-binding domain-containing protein [Candidatus Omnitrophota bacterium]MBI3021823.1 cobalamin B12-binding domain-containing protein [Candidatus Omnitrophota bacterium]
MTERHQFRVLLAYPNLSMMLTPSYAVGLFTAILKAQGYEIELFDCTPYLATYEYLGEPLPVTRANKLLNSRRFDAFTLWGEPKTHLLDDFVKTIEAFKPHVVIFSTLVEDTWPQAKDLLKLLAHYPSIKTLVGGVFSTMAPEVIADPHTQCVGLGEGEEVIVEFCECVRHGVAPTHIQGTWAKDVDGTVIHNPARPLVDINKVVPDFSLFDERRFLRPLGARIWKAIPLETYRGCPYTCTFCNSPRQVLLAKERQQGFFLRRKTMATLRHEMEVMIERYRPEFFYINDDAFMARPKQEIAEFVAMYKDFKIPFWFQTRFEDVDAEKLDWVSSVGCYRISFGLEHGNEHYRQEKLRRKMTNEFILQQSKIVTASGIPYTLNVLVGMPYETRELLFDSIRLCRGIGMFDSLSVNVFVPYHGTPLREMAIQEGWLDPEAQTTSVISKSLLTMPEPYLQADEILALQRVFPLYVRLPESRYQEVRIAEQDDDEGKAVFEALSKEFYQMVYGKDEAERMLTYAG